MEPMTLGSPVGSPTNQNPTSPFLPGFLMGDPMPQPTSPSKTPRQVHFTPNLNSSVHTPQTPGPTSFNESLSNFHKNQREKSGGPPTLGLFDTLEVNTQPDPNRTQPDLSSTFQHQSKLNQVHNLSTTASPAYNVQNSEENERWVTVFGFPPSAASSILAQFSQVGHIVEHRFPGQGNWVSICYSSKLDAKRALSYNGKILGGHTMIGVFPCSRNHNGSALKDMTNVLTSTDTPTTPHMTRAHRYLVTSPTSPAYLPSPRGGRPLGIASPTENEVMVAQNTPTKNTSFVTKAVDFVFGW